MTALSNRSIQGPVGGVALEMMDGGTLRNVTVSNVAIRDARAPLFVRLGNRGMTGNSTSGPFADREPGRLDGVAIENVVAPGAAVASSITGVPDRDAANVSLTDVTIETRGGRRADIGADEDGSDPGVFGEDRAQRDVPVLESTYPSPRQWGPLPAHGLFCRHVDGLSLRNLTVECEERDERPVLVCDEVSDLSVDGLSTDSGGEADPAVRLVDARRALLRDLRVPDETAVAVGVEGAASEDVAVDEATLFGATTSVRSNGDVPDGGLR